MLVSVIIAVYNTQKYLHKCVTSVLSQTYKNLEIILIDDGSTDISGRMCDEFTEKDNRVKVVHKENGGLSSARNVGNRMANGTYITYVDSDDYLKSDCIERLVDLCQKNKAQIGIIQMAYISEKTNEEIVVPSGGKVHVFSAETAIEESLYQRLFSCCAPAKLYTREIIRAIDFPEGKVSEDLATCHLFFDSANRIAYCDLAGYFYRQHDNSIMHTFNPKRLDAIVWAKEIEKFCIEKYPEIHSAAKCRTFNVAVHLAIDLPKTGDFYDRYIDQIWREVKRTRVQAMCDPRSRFREKIAALLSFGGPVLLKRVWNSKLAVKRKEM